MNTEALERFFREAGGKIEDKEKYCQFHQNGGGQMVCGHFADIL